MDHARNKLELADTEIPPLAFEEAAAFMKSRIPVTKAEWNALEPKLRFRAFTVARLAQLDYIDAARQVLTKALETGKGTAETYKQWQTLQTIVQDDAMRLRPGYWENVFRTNTQTAYVAGKLMQFQNNPPPAWRLLVIDDSRTSDICRGLLREGKNDLVLASDHPFWKTFGFPPYHYQCRTGLQAVYQSQINHGVRVENPTMNSLQGHFTPMKGFGGNPLEKESWFKLPQGMIDRAEKYGIVDEMGSLAQKLGIKDFAIQPAASEVTAEIKSAINMGTLEEKLPEEFVQGMREKLEAAPESFQKAWNNLADELKIVDAHYQGRIGAHFSPREGGVSFDSMKDSEMKLFVKINENFDRTGVENVAPKYSTAFHELFHNLSSAASARVGMSPYMDFAEVFQSKNQQGLTLTNMLHKEAEDRIVQVLNQLKEEAVKNGLKRGSVTRGDAYRYITQELLNMPVYEHCDISDIWDGCTKHKIQGSIGHPESGYWDRTPVGVEAFAEMGKATVNHPESLKRIQEYFPKSYEIFLEMIEFIGGL
jgi:effector-binding domain-containing protein